MDVRLLQQRYISVASTLFREEYLDVEYTRLQLMQDDSMPGFVVEVFSIFFEEFQRHLVELSRALEQHDVDFEKVEMYFHQLRDSSAGVGVQKVKNAVLAFRKSVEERKRAECITRLQLVKQEFDVVKTKLETLFELERQILAAGGVVPVI